MTTHAHVDGAAPSAAPVGVPADFPAGPNGSRVPTRQDTPAGAGARPGPADAGPRPPGRPRSARADEAIVTAVLDLLTDGTTVDALSIEAVAARAGVGKATIYRRWSNKEALVLHAIRSLKGDAPHAAGHSVREDLISLLTFMGRPHEGRALRILPCLISEVHRSPAQHRLYQELIEPRREVMREVLRRGIDTGEIRPDVDIEVTVALLAAPILVQKVLRWNPALGDPGLPARVVDMVLGGAGPH